MKEKIINYIIASEKANYERYRDSEVYVARYYSVVYPVPLIKSIILRKKTRETTGKINKIVIFNKDFDLHWIVNLKSGDNKRKIENSFVKESEINPGLGVCEYYFKWLPLFTYKLFKNLLKMKIGLRLVMVLATKIKQTYVIYSKIRSIAGLGSPAIISSECELLEFRLPLFIANLFNIKTIAIQHGLDLGIRSPESYLAKNVGVIGDYYRLQHNQRNNDYNVFVTGSEIRKKRNPKSHKTVLFLPAVKNFKEWEDHRMKINHFIQNTKSLQNLELKFHPRYTIPAAIKDAVSVGYHVSDKNYDDQDWAEIKNAIFFQIKTSAFIESILKSINVYIVDASLDGYSKEILNKLGFVKEKNQLSNGFDKLLVYSLDDYGAEKTKDYICSSLNPLDEIIKVSGLGRQ